MRGFAGGAISLISSDLGGCDRTCLTGIVIGNWVFEDSVESLMRMLSLLVGYEWDSWDSDALLAGLEESDGESDSWFAYRLGEEPTVEVFLARDLGTAAVRIRVEAPDVLRERVQFAVTVVQEFEVSPRGRS